MQLDIVTSLVALGYLLLFKGLWMLVASYTHEQQNAMELRIWAASNLLIGLAYGLFSTRGELPLLLSLVLGNFLFACGFGGYSIALARMFGQRTILGLVVASIALGTALLYWTEIVQGSAAYRMPILALLTIVVWVLSFLHCFQEYRRRPSPHVAAMTLVLLSIILVSFVRLALAYVTDNYGYQGLPVQYLGLKITTFVLVLAPPLLTVGFFLLCTERTQQKFKELATLDPLTGVRNRRSSLFLADRALGTGNELSCIMLDLDHFKRINDCHGHGGGDAVLTHLAAIVNGRLRKGDIFGRFGGEEFVIFLPGTNLAEADQLAEALRLALVNNPLTFEGKAIPFTASFGVAQWQKGESLSALTGRADKALYQAKDAGRNQVVSLP
ncbi:GGDEF domain-containing protein [Gallaecimonas kandeliae]|uniref:GGDEF domain-containing protein n=1 Tax=Gallaecimonas kandeliae TaxID=3029055 RepID=UPI0026470BAF|nr:GGDEF domain-containing protein [Gallaecimonas kandeliae]WKE64608.1 GGDEF domain-containing protein [Gallaecimonas kandeliae]